MGLVSSTLVGLTTVAMAVDVNRLPKDPAESLIPGEYIVVLKPETELSMVNTHLPTLEKAGATIIEKYDISSEFRGYAYKTNSVDAGEAAALELAALDDVLYIEQDQMMYASAPVSDSSDSSEEESCGLQKKATWGLSRVSSHETRTNRYTYPGSAGKGVYAYVIDSGVRLDHVEFSGRICEKKFDGYPSKNKPEGEDGNGHGTHVAGTIAGTTWGIAKDANICVAKVLSAEGSGSNSVVIAGVQWACAEEEGRESIKDRVANMSLGGGRSRALDQAVKACVDKGMPFIVAAGNERDDACMHSPAAEFTAITVMATDRNDDFAVFSNFGTCANIFAPGQDITSAWIDGPESTNTISGTSMASPHVCGVAALIKGNHRDLSPEQILDRMLQSADSNKISRIPDQPMLTGVNSSRPVREPRNTPNELLFSDCYSD